MAEKFTSWDKIFFGFLLVKAALLGALYVSIRKAQRDKKGKLKKEKL